MCVRLQIPYAGGVVVKLLSPDFGCLPSIRASLLSLTCHFGGPSSPAVFNTTTNTLDCVAPAGEPNTLVIVTVTLQGQPLPFATPLSLFYADPLERLTDFQYINETCLACTGIPNPYMCPRDCAGVIYGSAWVDTCNVCVGGTTGRISNITAECNGVPCNGTWVRDPATDW